MTTRMQFSTIHSKIKPKYIRMVNYNYQLIDKSKYNIELYYFTCNDVCCRNKNLQSRTFTVPFEDSTPRGHEIITTN